MKKTIVIFISLALCKYLAAQDASTLLSDYIKIRSVSGKEKKAAEYFSKRCEKAGLSIQTFTNSDSSYNFSASLLPLSCNKPNIILLNHIDVVAAEDSIEWRIPPYSGKIVNDTIWGRGALDMKGMAVMQLMALLDIKKKLSADDLSKLPYNISILCLSGEETGGKNGGAIVTDKYMDVLKPSVVLGEGGGGLKNIIPGKPNQQIFFVSLAEKKSLWIKLHARLRAHGHASVPSSKNANKIMLHAINKIDNAPPQIKFDHTTKLMFKNLGRITGGYKGFVLKHISWWIFKPFRKKILYQNEAMLPLVINTFQLTKIYNPPGALNQIPQMAEAYFDCRLLPRFNEKPLTLKRLLHIIDPRIKIEVLDESPEAMPTKPDIYFEQLELAIKKTYPQAEVVPFLFLASSDNSYFRAKGIPTYGIMPVELNQELMESVHGANERIAVKALYKGIETYTFFLNQLLK